MSPQSDRPGRPDRPDAAVLAGLFPGHEHAIDLYVDLLTSLGVDRGLIGPREAPRIWQRHILNCAVIAPAFGTGQTVCDLGSGAGLPGIVLALARPDLRVTLLEPSLRRATFLAEVVDRLQLTSVEVVRARAEDAGAEVQVMAVTARAVAPIERLTRWALPLLSPGGELMAIKGDRADEEVVGARSALSRLGVSALRVESYGAGVVDPPTRIVRLESPR